MTKILRSHAQIYKNMKHENSKIIENMREYEQTFFVFWKIGKSILGIANRFFLEWFWTWGRFFIFRFFQFLFSSKTLKTHKNYGSQSLRPWKSVWAYRFHGCKWFLMIIFTLWRSFSCNGALAQWPQSVTPSFLLVRPRKLESASTHSACPAGELVRHVRRHWSWCNQHITPRVHIWKVKKWKIEFLTRFWRLGDVTIWKSSPAWFFTPCYTKFGVFSASERWVMAKLRFFLIFE